MASLQTVINAKGQHEADWLRASPQIVSVGVGVENGDHVIVVGVASLKKFTAEQAALSLSAQIPGEVTVLSSSGDENVRVIVKEVGEIIAQNTARVRPCPGGFSVGHTRVTAGTFGCLASFRGGPLAGRAFILSNNHVLANSNNAVQGDRIVQPGIADGGGAGDQIAALTRWVPLIANGDNYVDAAIAEVSGGPSGWGDFVATYVKDIGVPSRTTLEPSVGMKVEKSGRTTGHTLGQVDQVNVTTRVTYRGAFPDPLVFKDQVLLSPMSKPGDSGSVIFRAGTREAVALLFAGSDQVTIASRINLVLSHLTQRAAFQSADGAVVVFDETGPLQLGIEGGAIPHGTLGLDRVVAGVIRHRKSS